MRGLEEVALSFSNDLFDHMITFHQEVTISCDIGCLEGMQQVQPKMCENHETNIHSFNISTLNDKYKGKKDEWLLEAVMSHPSLCNGVL